MKRAVVVAPNLGASFAGGGGASVAANVAQTMLEDKIHVSLLAFAGYSNDTLDRLHGTSLSDCNGLLSSHYLFNRRFGNRGLHKAVSSPATSLALFGFHYYLSLQIKSIKPDLIWFNDDVPRLCEPKLKNRYSIQYVNFSFQTRLKSKVNEQWEDYSQTDIASKAGRGDSRMTQILIGKKALGCNIVIANSSVTFRYIRETSNEVQPMIVYPPVQIADYEVLPKKTNQILAIGAFRPNKRFGDIIRAMDISRESDLKLVIAGLRDDDDYLDYLRRLIVRLNLQNRVFLVPNASRSFLGKLLVESSAILSAARFEPFGISVVEGMSAGCVPIVYAGEDSGPWIDITLKGRYGLGFHDTEELSQTLAYLSHGITRTTRQDIKARASEFNSGIFRKRIRRIIARID